MWTDIFCKVFVIGRMLNKVLMNQCGLKLYQINMKYIYVVELFTSSLYLVVNILALTSAFILYAYTFISAVQICSTEQIVSVCSTEATQLTKLLCDSH